VSARLSAEDLLNMLNAGVIERDMLSNEAHIAATEDAP
jgi:hypothetical protein